MKIIIKLLALLFAGNAFASYNVRLPDLMHSKSPVRQTVQKKLDMAPSKSPIRQTAQKKLDMAPSKSPVGQAVVMQKKPDMMPNEFPVKPIPVLQPAPEMVPLATKSVGVLPSVQSSAKLVRSATKQMLPTPNAQPDAINVVSYSQIVTQSPAAKPILVPTNSKDDVTRQALPLPLPKQMPPQPEVMVQAAKSEGFLGAPKNQIVLAKSEAQLLKGSTSTCRKTSVRTVRISSLFFEINDLIEAIQDNKLAKIKNLLLEKGNCILDENIPGDGGYNILMYAVQYSKPETVQFLLQDFDGHEFKLEQVDNHGCTVLMHAAGNNEMFEIVAELLQTKKVEIDTKDAQGLTALMHAVAIPDNTRTVVLLLQEGADYKDTDDDRFSVLDHAVLHQNIAAVEILLSHNISNEQLDNAIEVLVGEYEKIKAKISKLNKEIKEVQQGIESLQAGAAQVKQLCEQMQQAERLLSEASSKTERATIEQDIRKVQQEINEISAKTGAAMVVGEYDQTKIEIAALNERIKIDQEEISKLENSRKICKIIYKLLDDKLAGRQE